MKGPSPLHRSCKTDHVAGSSSHQIFGRLVGQMQHLKDAFRKPRLLKSLRETLGTSDGLGRMLKNHYVARSQGRNNRVYCNQIGIVPGRDDEDEPLR